MRKTEYKGLPLYLNMYPSSRMFQYLFIHNNQIYQRHVLILPKFLRGIVWSLFVHNFVPSPYTKSEVEFAETALLSGALASIDKLLDVPEENNVAPASPPPVSTKTKVSGQVKKQ